MNSIRRSFGLGVQDRVQLGPLLKQFVDYKTRVLADGGVFYDTSYSALQRLIRDNNSYGSNLKICINPALGATKLRTSGIYNFATKGYDISPIANDATQTTATNQPYLSKIAPIEKPALLNPNGDDTYMVHPTISFGASDPWSVEVVLNWNGNINGNATKEAYICGTTGSGSIRLRSSNSNKLELLSDALVSSSYTGDNSKFIGKTSIVTFVAYGGGSLDMYHNGTLIQSFPSLTDRTKLTINKILDGRNGYYYQGKLYHYAIFSKALSSSEVANRAALLRSIYPEIESVPIGTQTWAVMNYDAVCTPQGNLIPEVQAATNTEKITNAADMDFSSDTGFWTKIGATISGGVCNIKTTDGSYASILRGSIITAGKWYKVSYDITRNSGGSLAIQNGTTPFEINSTIGVGKIIYFLNASSAFEFKRWAGATDIDIDNVSIQEVGWSDSQGLFDYIYANTAGTVEQKTYAAVKAAAMWRSPNNDVALAANYSKLYNDFATKLFDMDINYYNVANPTTPWGWRIPTESDWTTLQTYINNDANALEHLGTTYWTSGQGTNTTGFTALPAGYVKEDGTYAGSGTTAIFASSDDMSIPRLGKSIRLIKA